MAIIWWETPVKQVKAGGVLGPGERGNVKVGTLGGQGYWKPLGEWGVLHALLGVLGALLSEATCLALVVTAEASAGLVPRPLCGSQPAQLNPSLPDSLPLRPLLGKRWALVVIRRDGFPQTKDSTLQPDHWSRCHLGSCDGKGNHEKVPPTESPELKK